jgi:hypothetical protein
MPLSVQEIQDRVTYHAPTPSGVDRHNLLSHAIGDAMETVENVCHDSREKSLALTKLEEAKFWASAAVARNMATR